MSAPYRGFTTPPTLRSRDRRLPWSLRASVLFERRGNYLLALVLITIGLFATNCGLIAFSVYEGYSGATPGVLESCRTSTTKNSTQYDVAYRYTIRGIEHRASLSRGGAAYSCPKAAGFMVKYVPSNPEHSSPVGWPATTEATIASLIVGGIGGSLVVVGLAFLLPLLVRRRRILRVVQQGALVRGRLLRENVGGTIDAWGTTASELTFELTAPIGVLSEITVSTAAAERLRDDPTERLLLMPPTWQEVVAIDSLPGELNLNDEKILSYGPVDWAQLLWLPVAAIVEVAAVVAILLLT